MVKEFRSDPLVSHGSTFGNHCSRRISCCRHGVGLDGLVGTFCDSVHGGKRELLAISLHQERNLHHKRCRVETVQESMDLNKSRSHYNLYHLCCLLLEDPLVYIHPPPISTTPTTELGTLPSGLLQTPATSVEFCFRQSSGGIIAFAVMYGEK